MLRLVGALPADLAKTLFFVVAEASISAGSTSNLSEFSSFFSGAPELKLYLDERGNHSYLSIPSCISWDLVTITIIFSTKKAHYGFSLLVALKGRSSRRCWNSLYLRQSSPSYCPSPISPPCSKKIQTHTHTHKKKHIHSSWVSQLHVLLFFLLRLFRGSFSHFALPIPINTNGTKNCSRTLCNSPFSTFGGAPSFASPERLFSILILSTFKRIASSLPTEECCTYHQKFGRYRARSIAHSTDNTTIETRNTRSSHRRFLVSLSSFGRKAYKCTHIKTIPRTRYIDTHIFFLSLSRTHTHTQPSRHPHPYQCPTSHTAHCTLSCTRAFSLPPLGISFFLGLFFCLYVSVSNTPSTLKPQKHHMHIVIITVSFQPNEWWAQNIEIYIQQDSNLRIGFLLLCIFLGYICFQTMRLGYAG